MSIKKCKNLVTDILTEQPKTRDNDLLLIEEVWKFQSGVIDLLSHPVGFLFELMLEKKVSHPSSIKRARAKLQELCPNLRGEVYNKRHQLQKEVYGDLETISAEATDPSYWRVK